MASLGPEAWNREPEQREPLAWLDWLLLAWVVVWLAAAWWVTG